MWRCCVCCLWCILQVICISLTWSREILCWRSANRCDMSVSLIIRCSALSCKATIRKYDRSLEVRSEIWWQGVDSRARHISDHFEELISQKYIFCIHVPSRPKKTAYGFHCNNFVYSQSIFITFGTYTLLWNLQLDDAYLAHLYTVCVTTLPWKIVITVLSVFTNISIACPLVTFHLHVHIYL